MVKLAEKLYENERLFEEINEGLIDQTKNILPTDIPEELLMDLYCECGDEDCRDRIELSLAEFREIHADKFTFMVKPNHYFPRFEQILKKHINHWIVRKKQERLPEKYKNQLK